METTEVIKATTKVSDFIEAYDFEVYDIAKTIDLCVEYRSYMFLAIGIYLSGIYFGQKWMKNRPAYKLQFPLFLWNFSIAIFSIVSTIRGWPELAHLLAQPNGLYLSMCSGLPHNYATSFWALMFMLSKFVEFGDTAFIVLRKQKLIVLHWFHHVATLLMCWFGFEYYDAFGRYFILNTFVHSIMYSYYALKAAKVKIPRKLSKALTTLQILQMFVAIFVNFYSLYLMARGHPCKRHKNVIYLAGVIIPIFTALFVNFFVKTYSTPKRSKGKAE